MATDLDRNFTLGATGDVTVLTGDAATAQRLLLRVATNQGEWPYQRDFGVPWLFAILGQVGDSIGQRRLVKAALEADADVEGVQIVDVTFDRVTRRSNMRFSCKLRSGASVSV